MHIRQAFWTQDQATLLQIRHTVFVVEQGVPPELEPDAQDSQAVHLLAFADADTAVGTARLTPDGYIGRMAVLSPWRGRGVGTQLLQHLLHIARTRRMTNVYLHAQVHALDFYTRLGFVAQGHTFMEAGIKHQLMQYNVPA